MRGVVNKIGLRDVYEAAFDSFAVPVYEDAPFTTIINRAKVTRSLKAIAGVERVIFTSLNLLANEFGPNGERVWECDDKDSRVRFVGGLTNTSSVDGSFILFNSTTDYAEITFYGTGLNILSALDSNNRSLVASIDGGAEGSSLFTSGSSVLTGRGYPSNQVFNVVSGLSLGWHTARIRRTGAVGALLFGIEILNERSDILVYQGTANNNGKYSSLDLLSTSPFATGVVGTKGARVVKYIENGELKTAVTEVDSTAQYLTNANHTNEEVVRRINFREFGANRSDDFSTLGGTASTRAFTLDDGVTTLIGSTVNAATANTTEYIAITVSNGFWTLTFIGTGLDIIEAYAAPSVTIDSATFFVDGVSVGTVTSAVTGVRRICSGLPYGTHTVKMIRNAVTTTSLSVVDFIIYQPKKPAFTGVEVADYNVVATYSNPANTNVAGVPTGVLRKMSLREMVYIGTWSNGGANTLSASGFAITTTTAASYVEYTFWGTGFNYRFGNNAGAQNFTVSVNGSTNLSSLTTALSATAGLTFTPGTGVITGSPAVSIGENNLSVTGLILGRHTVRVTYNSGSILSPGCIDVITPIHINGSSLKSGNQSLKSINKYSAVKTSGGLVDLSRAKAWVYYDGVNQRIISSYNVSAVLKRVTGAHLVFFQKPFKGKYIPVATGSVAEARCTGGVNSNDAAFSNSFTEVITQNSAGTATDGFFGLVVYGELIDEE